MARFSRDLLRHADNIYSTIGFGNSSILNIFGILGITSLFALTGMLFPELAASMSSLLTLSLGGVTFLGIAFLSGLSFGGVIGGLIAGLIIASISSILCSIIALVVPPLALLVVLPNVYVAGVYGCALVCSFFESCFARLGMSHSSLKSKEDKANAQVIVSPQPRHCPKASSGGLAFFDKRTQPSDANANANAADDDANADTDEYQPGLSTHPNS